MNKFQEMYRAAQQADTSSIILDAAHTAVEGIEDRRQRAKVLTPAFALANLVSELAWAQYNTEWTAAGPPDWTA